MKNQNYPLNLYTKIIHWTFKNLVSISAWSHPSDLWSHPFDPRFHPSDPWSHPSDPCSHPSDPISHPSDPISHPSDPDPTPLIPDPTPLIPYPTPLILIPPLWSLIPPLWSLISIPLFPGPFLWFHDPDFNIHLPVPSPCQEHVLWWISLKVLLLVHFLPLVVLSMCWWCVWHFASQDSFEHRSYIFEAAPLSYISAT